MQPVKGTCFSLGWPWSAGFCGMKPWILLSSWNPLLKLRGAPGVPEKNHPLPRLASIPWSVALHQQKPLRTESSNLSNRPPSLGSAIVSMSSKYIHCPLKPYTTSTEMPWTSGDLLVFCALPSSDSGFDPHARQLLISQPSHFTPKS